MNCGRQRFTDFSPTVGTRTKEIWVDVDAGKDQNIESLKPVVLDVDSLMKKLPGVQGSGISFSGGSGFHVRGILDKAQDTTKMRKML